MSGPPPRRFGRGFAFVGLETKGGRPWSTAALAQRFFQLTHPLLQGCNRLTLLFDQFALLPDNLHQPLRIFSSQFFDQRTLKGQLSHAVKSTTPN